MDFNTTVSTHLESSRHTLPSCILYQNHQVTLIDLPCSIAAAQNRTLRQPSCRRMLRSCAPLTAPFPTNEPKSDLAKSRLKAKMGSEYDELYSDCISQALLTIRHNYRRHWCLPRLIAPQPLTVGKKRKASELHQSETPHETTETPQNLDLDTPGPAQQTTPEPSKRHGKPEGLDPCHLEVQLSVLLRLLASEDTPQAHAHASPYQLHWTHNEHNQPETITVHDSNAASCWGHHLFNSALHCRKLEVTSTRHVTPITFHIPPGAHFFLGDCSNSRPFHLAVRNHARAENTAAQFDIVLMDPPRPNSSVSRARKSGAAYDTAPTIWDIRQLIFDMDIDVLLAANGLVAIWITNRPAVRDLVLGEDGLFDSWGVHLEEEWLWIKTTRVGDPVSPPDSYWRKPYELLLLGRKQASQHDNVGVNQQVKRRVIAAVPDLHSRKPCLRELFEPLMPNPASYRALEVFARYLVAGWWSWGNEVIKFNHESCWAEIKQD